MASMEGAMRIPAAVVTMVLGATLASAGEPATFGLGSRVRAHVGRDRAQGAVVGVVAATDADTLTLVLENGATRDVPWRDVRRLDLSRGRRSVGAGIARGAGIGLAAGA